MNINKNVKILLTTLFCLISGAVWCVPKNSSTTSLTNTNQLPTEAECIANTKQIRDIMINISTDGTVSRSVLQKLDIALDKNRVFFEKHEKDGNIRELLFGENRNSINDYDLFWDTTWILRQNVKGKFDTNIFAVIARMPASLRNVVKNSAEWSEYLDEIVLKFALDAPLTMVKYLNKCSKDEFDSVFHELYLYLYEIPGKKEELDFKLAKISTQEKKYAKIIEKIRSRINEDSIKYFSI